MIFTLPAALWKVVESDPVTYVEAMFEASKETIMRIFEDRFGAGAGRVIPGIISVIHFNGRDMKHNPHIHMLVTEGGLTDGMKWKILEHFPYQNLNAYWKHEVLTRFRMHSKHSLEFKSIIDNQFKLRLKNGTNGYVVKNYRNVMGSREKDIGKYLARYIRHPPIKESRILSFDGKFIRIKYEWDNSLHEISISLEDFIHAILLNILPKGFRAVRQYGLYSNPMYHKAYAVLMSNPPGEQTKQETKVSPMQTESICKCKLPAPKEAGVLA